MPLLIPAAPSTEEGTEGSPPPEAIIAVLLLDRPELELLFRLLYADTNRRKRKWLHLSCNIINNSRL